MEVMELNTGGPIGLEHHTDGLCVGRSSGGSCHAREPPYTVTICSMAVQPGKNTDLVTDM
jgi:hypothetical protein